MSYALNCDDGELDPHFCGGCEDDTEEHGRIRRGAWINKDVIAALIADPTNATVWNTHIASGKIIILPELTGTFDGGTPKIGPGYGDLKDRYLGSDFKANIKDPVYKKNFGHYRSLVGKSSWHFAYCTESQVHITSKPVTVTPRAPITENLEDVVVWESEITWFESFTPAPHDVPDVFDCDNPDVALAIITHPASQALTEADTLLLQVVAEGTAPLTYQWKKGGVNISGATSSSYTIPEVDLADAGSFTVVVSDNTGSVTSNIAVITVAAITFDTILTFASSTTDTDQSVTGTVSATNATQRFEFNKDLTITGTPQTMELKLSGATVCIIDFPGDYLGHPFRYTHTTGTTYTGNFANGNVTIS